MRRLHKAISFQILSECRRTYSEMALEKFPEIVRIEDTHGFGNLEYLLIRICQQPAGVFQSCFLQIFVKSHACIPAEHMA